MKKCNTLALVFILLFSLVNPMIAKADAKKSYSIETINSFTVNANIKNADNFDGEIYLIITDSKNMKRVFVLNKNNNFSSTYQLPIGQAKILDMTVYDRDRNQIAVPYTYTGKLNATTEEAAQFTINLDNNNLSTESLDQDNENTEDENSSSSDDNETAQQEKTNDEQKNDKENNTESTGQVPSGVGIRTIINWTINIIAFIVVGGLLLYIKFKEKNNKKDEQE